MKLRQRAKTDLQRLEHNQKTALTFNAYSNTIMPIYETKRRNDLEKCVKKS